MGGNVLPLPLVMKAFETHLSHLDPASPARLLSQAGPHAARVFAASPMSSPVVVPSAHLRLLLLPPFLARREAEARVVWNVRVADMNSADTGPAAAVQDTARRKRHRLNLRPRVRFA